MAAQAGKDFLLKVGAVAATPVTVAGMRTTSFDINGTTVDATTKDSAGVRELLAAGGVSSLSISASGVLAGNAQSTDFIGYVKARSLQTFSLFFDDGATIEASFQVTKFSAAGQFDGEQTYDITMESSGAITVTAAA